jgi:hypothetical protein
MAGDNENEGGEFLLESLANLGAIDARAEEESSRGSLFGIGEDKPSRFAKKNNLIGFDPNRELRELREKQQRLEQKMLFLTLSILFVVISVVISTQTQVVSATIAKISSLSGGRTANCALPANANLPECLTKRNGSSETWRSIERGASSQFSLHGKK